MDPEPSTPPPVMPNVPPPAPPTSWRLYFELLSFAFFVVPSLGHVLGPLVLWLMNKDSDPVADAEGKRVINFNLSWSLWIIASCGLGFFAWIVIAIIATLKAANNEPFQHPWTIGFLK